MPLTTSKSKVGGTAMRSGQFALLYSAMLVSAAGNTALQSVMPAIGRAVGMADVFVALAYTSSAALWVWFAPYWARVSDRRGRKPLILLGVAGFTVSTFLCGVALLSGMRGLLAVAPTFVVFAIVRALYGGFGCATPSATQAYLASKTRRSSRVKALSSLASSFSLGTIVGPALAPLFVLPFLGLTGPLFVFALIGGIVFVAILIGLPNDQPTRDGRGAAMSYPSQASPPTGASVIASTKRKSRIRWFDDRIRDWIIAGVATNHAMAAILTCIGFFVIDKLALDPMGAEQQIALVMMAGAGSTLLAQWVIIPKLDMRPRMMILAGSAIGAVGMLGTMMATNLYEIVLGFTVTTLGFGFTRPGFTAGASLAVPLREQGGVAGIVTSANGIAFVAAPTLGVVAYGIDQHLPFAAAAALLVIVIAWGWRRLD